MHESPYQRALDVCVVLVHLREDCIPHLLMFSSVMRYRIVWYDIVLAVCDGDEISSTKFEEARHGYSQLDR
jgi:hypothetical protein